jgi:hypothetical protein
VIYSYVRAQTVQLLVRVFDDFQIKFEIVCGLQLKKRAVCKTSCSKNVATGFISARFHLGGHGAPAVQPPCAGANLKDEAAAPGMPLRCRWLRASPNDAVREPCDTPSPMARWRRRLSRMYTLVIGLVNDRSHRGRTSRCCGTRQAAQGLFEVHEYRKSPK